MSLVPAGRPLPRWACAALLALIVIGAFFARMRGGDHVVEPDRFWIDDPDTLRRLVRLERLVDGRHAYPFVEEYDGYPHGSVLHWTLPMDGVILALDRVARPFYPQARFGEAGAIWAGPILSTAAVLLYGCLALRLLAPTAALLATALYAASYSAIGVGEFGNGDHQSLQHLGLVGALLGLLVLMARRGGSGIAVFTGLSLGLALWVSTESQSVLLVMGAATCLELALTPVAAAALKIRLHLLWATLAAVVVFASGWIEHGRPFAYTWDQVSALQLHVLLVYALFLLLVPLLSARSTLLRAAPWRAVLAATLVATAIGTAPWLVTPLGAELRQQLLSFEASNRWVQNMVSEFRPLLTVKDSFRIEEALHRFTPMIFAAPLLLFGFLRHPALGWPARCGGGLLCVGCFALCCYEVKLAHFFQILWPILLVLGGAWWISRWPLPNRGLFASSRVAAATGIAALCVTCYVMPRGAWSLSPRQLVVDELCAALRNAQGRGPDPRLEPSVLAHWSLGAHILYYARRPVVASAYHRNLEGIHDGLRAFVARSSAEIEPILRKHNVRWFVAESSFNFFEEVGRVLPELGTYATATNVRYKGNGEFLWDFRFEIDPRTKRARYYDTVLWNFGLEPRVDDQPQRRLLYESASRRPIPSLGFSAPVYRLFEVRLGEELSR